MKVFQQTNTSEKYITNAEMYLEPSQKSTMELFVLTVFAKKSIIDFRLGSKYASVMKKRYLKLAFSKILKVSQKITIMEF